jgi:dienelactone hydrolase/thiol-disulfide isomerase/thioredoxin
MVFRLNRRRLFAVLLVLIGAIAAAGYFLFDRPPDIRDFWAVRGDWDAAGEETDDQKNVLATRCLEVAEKHPGTVGGLSALFLASTRAPKTAAGKEAHQQLAQQIKTADMGRLAASFDRGVVGKWHSLENLAPAFLARARQSPDHPKAARLLAAVCAATLPNEDGNPPAIYEEAGNLIADQYASSPEISHFCEGLRSGARWAVPYERHLRAILQVNQDRMVRCSAQFALAKVVQASTEDRQAEAQELFEHFLAEFDGKYSYHAQGIEQQYIAEAKDQLVELRQRAVGQPAPEITGIDLDDKRMKLSDYRGRVVLLNFWGTWCFPCMKLISHELELVKTFQMQPFDIVGVNCDADIPKARAAVAQTKMTWRSFRDKIDDKSTITTQWKVLGFPSLYLIDHHGTIRKRWVGSPAADELEHMVGVLVDAARRNVASDAMKPVVAALPLPAAKSNPVGTPTNVAPQPGSGFVEKVYRSGDGSESKYVVFVPRTYAGTKSFPAILYLHGAGSRGTDGQLPIKYGLAKAIRAKMEDFPFIVIIPQARDGEGWTAESAGGKRALAILDQVQTDYRIDADRVSLTGHSMGGQGTWSLAAADPKRWAALVPVSHGGDTKLAARLIDIPCWCFHGDADKIISVQQSREMVRAIKEAGGRPLYHEFSGVGHNEAADRTYSLSDLYEWMLLQNRARR